MCDFVFSFNIFRVTISGILEYIGQVAGMKDGWSVFLILTRKGPLGTLGLVERLIRE